MITQFKRFSPLLPRSSSLTYRPICEIALSCMKFAVCKHYRSCKTRMSFCESSEFQRKKGPKIFLSRNVHYIVSLSEIISICYKTLEVEAAYMRHLYLFKAQS